MTTDSVSIQSGIATHADATAAVDIKAADPGAAAYRAERVANWDRIARLKDTWKGLGGGYHRRLAEIYRFLIVPGRRVLEVGCGFGDLLASLHPSAGVGVDFSPETVARARLRHPALTFLEADAHALEVEGPFDAIVLSDLINDVWDVQGVLERLRPVCIPRTRIILNFYSHLWEKPLAIGQRLKLASPMLSQNWVTVPDVANLLNLAGFEMTRHWEEVLWPIRTPLVDGAFNKVLVRLWPMKMGALTNFIMARPQPTVRNQPKTQPTPGMQAYASAPMNEIALTSAVAGTNAPIPEPKVSVIVPARNESGNIARIFARTPELGGGTELIFVEGHSSDDTYATIEREMASNPGLNCKLFRQTGKGKGDAVRLGFAQAAGEVLMILDADLTVPPEDLPRFYHAIRDGKGEFINGVRLVYPMERKAMRLLNLAGNKFFSLAFTWLLGQPIKDTLCGTKVMWRADYERLAANRAYFGDFDPFGDFDLLFGAAKMNLKIIDLPIRYRERTYGASNIQRWKHGWLLLKMCAFAAGKVKFV